MVEPGYFRTDFLDASSLSVSSRKIPDYEATAGKVRTVAGGLNHNQPGDPSKLADVLVAFADAPNPPVRLPLGSDTVAALTTIFRIRMHQTQTFVHLTTGLFDLTDSVVPPSFFDSQNEGAPAANI